MLVNVRYPPHIWGIDAVRASVEAGDVAGELLEDYIQEIEDNQTVLHSRESGIARREEILGILPSPVDTLEDRRLRVHLLWYNRDSYTENSLREKLNATLGKEHYRLNILFEEKTVSVALELTRRRMKLAVERLLDEIVPLDYLLSVVLRYNQYKDLKKYTYKQLKRKTWNQLRNEVIDIGIDG